MSKTVEMHKIRRQNGHIYGRDMGGTAIINLYPVFLMSVGRKTATSSGMAENFV